MPPVVIAGAIAGVGAIGAAAIGSSGARSAANATASAADRASQVQENNYLRSAAALSPWQQSGLAANSQINALLGIGGVAAASSMGPMGGTPYSGGNPLYGTPEPSAVVRAMNPNFYAAWQAAQSAGQGTAGSASGTAGQTAQQAAEGAFNNYRNSTGYQFRLNQGLNAVNSGYAGSGTLKSGAALKSINDYGQGMATQEFGNYIASLGNQQQLGFSAASAQAGVGQNTANSLAQIYQNQGNNAANAALARSANTANAVNSLAGIGSNLFGQLSGPSTYQRLAPSVSQTFAQNGSIF